MNRDLYICISGHQMRPFSGDLIPFWRGFIALQKSIPDDVNIKQIYCHSWNPELSSLIKLVYGALAPHVETQRLYWHKFIELIDPPDFFESGVKREKLVTRKVTLQSLTAQAASRSKATAKLPEDLDPTSRVLLTRWDIGQTGSKFVNRPVIDLSLPNDYVYIADFPQLDEGYADMWVLCSPMDARAFRNYEPFLLESLGNKNGFRQKFCETGWPRSRPISLFERILLSSYADRYYRFLLAIVSSIESLVGSGRLQRHMSRYRDGLELKYRKPVLKAEIDLVEDTSNLRTYKSHESINMHAILKFFMLKKFGSERIRMLSGGDFECSNRGVSIINPAEYHLISFDKGIVYAGKTGNIAGADRSQWLPVSVSKVKTFDELRVSIKEITRVFGPEAVIVVSSSERRHYSCRDWAYFNALLKYISWSKLGFVALEATSRGLYFAGFPDLHLYRGGLCNISLSNFAGTSGFIDDLFSVSYGSLSCIKSRLDLMKVELVGLSPVHSSLFEQ